LNEVLVASVTGPSFVEVFSTAFEMDALSHVDAPPTFWPVVDAVSVAAVDAAAVVSDDADVSVVEDDPHPTRRAAEQRVTAATAPMRGIFM
jgi:hypothetical protein